MTGDRLLFVRTNVVTAVVFFLTKRFRDGRRHRVSKARTQSRLEANDAIARTWGNSNKSKFGPKGFWKILEKENPGGLAVVEGLDRRRQFGPEVFESPAGEGSRFDDKSTLYLF
ncbi:Hypothetical protein NTJ_08783 [Nesidiocoris tenuis]|uniref:Uncharacterized protein n=1 Tax=Nesidiocoris tenuis TaxID=355587 RepID=A0ABN7AWT5_9HEMI|nr:Hypothetical protein NTJ_08783 [Nesidiocoris tenuis]